MYQVVAGREREREFTQSKMKNVLWWIKIIYRLNGMLSRTSRSGKLFTYISPCDIVYHEAKLMQ